MSIGGSNNNLGIHLQMMQPLLFSEFNSFKEYCGNLELKVHKTKEMVTDYRVLSRDGSGVCGWQSGTDIFVGFVM